MATLKSLFSPGFQKPGSSLKIEPVMLEITGFSSSLGTVSEPRTVNCFCTPGAKPHGFRTCGSWAVSMNSKATFS
jgi:hypothetical protein